MVFPKFTLTQLAEFTNKPEDYFDPDKVEVNLSQASLLFRLATCLKELPDDADERELAVNGILDLANKFYETAFYESASHSPFTSETIGSYSYNISLAKLKNGESLGSTWFDMAVAMLGVCSFFGEGISGTGGIELFEHDGHFVPGNLKDNVRYVSTGDLYVDGNPGRL